MNLPEEQPLDDLILAKYSEIGGLIRSGAPEGEVERAHVELRDLQGKRAAELKGPVPEFDVDAMHKARQILAKQYPGSFEKD